jgi:hypothetical protein
MHWVHCGHTKAGIAHFRSKSFFGKPVIVNPLLLHTPFVVEPAVCWFIHYIQKQMPPSLQDSPYLGEQGEPIIASKVTDQFETHHKVKHIFP